MKKVLVLNYHRIISSSLDARKEPSSSFSLGLSSFKEQMAFISRSSIPVVSLSDIMDNKIESDFSVAITFDDGNVSDYTEAFPILLKYQYPATFFIPINNRGKEMLTTEQLARILGNPAYSVGSHGVNHTELTKLPKDKLSFEIYHSKEMLEKTFGYPVDFFALPYGMYNPHILKICRQAGYKAALTTRFKLNFPGDLQGLMHRWSLRNSVSLEQFEKLLNPVSREFHKKVRNSWITTHIRMMFTGKLIGRYFVSDK
jgi:peptidoglycan/xylan/chitin deacetylase (PgdA/CDA1 family)